MQATNKLKVRRLESWDMETYWPIIKDAASTMYTPARDITQEDLVEVLAKLISEAIQCWVVFQEDEPLAVMLTSLERDPLYNKLYLGVLGFKAVVDTGIGMTSIDILNQYVERYAKHEGCEYIVARTDDPRIAKLIRHYGGQPMPYYYKEI